MPSGPHNLQTCPLGIPEVGIREAPSSKCCPEAWGQCAPAHPQCWAEASPSFWRQAEATGQRKSKPPRSCKKNQSLRGARKRGGLRGPGLGYTIDARIEGRFPYFCASGTGFRAIYPLQIVVRPQCAMHAGSGSLALLMPGARGGHQPLEYGKMLSLGLFPQTVCSVRVGKGNGI